jgi:hypothetical protein
MVQVTQWPRESFELVIALGDKRWFRSLAAVYISIIVIPAIQYIWLDTGGHVVVSAFFPLRML